jgi:hypothetical protein
LGKQIADLTFIADTNKKSGDESTTYRKHIESEIQTTQEYLTWINNRRQEILRKRTELIDQRCYSSLMFVKALKEHDEALQVIKWLKEDVLGIIAAGPIELSQIANSANKLAAYAHLFNDNAMKEFAQLTAPVDASTAQWNDQATDNSRDALNVDRMGSGADERDVGGKLVEAINKLEQHLIASMADLKKNEITAAWDLVAWLNDSERELDHLDEEQSAKTTYIDKLLITIIGAKAHEDKTWEIYFESASTLNNAIDDLEAKREFWADEKARRDDENEVLDGVIKMFVERVTNLDSGMRGKLAGDQDLYRRTDDAYSKDFGKMAGNVAREAALF